MYMSNASSKSGNRVAVKNGESVWYLLSGAGDKVAGWEVLIHTPLRERADETLVCLENNPIRCCWLEVLWLYSTHLQIVECRLPLWRYCGLGPI